MNQSEYMDTLEAENAKLRRELSELKAKLAKTETDRWYDEQSRLLDDQ
jgi:hypothetical protein